MKHIIIGTAGHIDHGKTTLIKALTGRETDTLKEEKERGISINLGFTFFDLPSGKRAGIVDVPGHERFIKNMLAGVSGIDMVLLVIAADEGVMPQTKEHLNILSLLDVKKGIVVVTKKDMVDEEWLEVVIEDIREYLKGTFLENADLIPVSSLTRDGLDRLVECIDRLSEEVVEKDTDNCFRLPVDRAFSVSGFGTVVTGTVISGKISEGDKVEIYPSLVETKVRNIEVHDTPVKTAYAGQRLAINLSNIKVGEVKRGDVVAEKGSMDVSMMIDCRLVYLKDAPRPLENRDRVRVYHGTSEILGRVVLLDREVVNPGDSALIQIRLEGPIAAQRGDKYVIRAYSPMITIGGGTIIDPNPSKHKRMDKRVIEELLTREKGNPADIIEQAVRKNSSSFPTKDAILKLSGRKDSNIDGILEELVSRNRIIAIKTSEGVCYLHRDYLDKITARLKEMLQRFHSENPLKRGMDKEEVKSRLFEGNVKQKLFDYMLSLLEEQKIIKTGGKYVSLHDFEISLSPLHENIKEKLLNMYHSSGINSPKPEEAMESIGEDYKDARMVFELLIDTGELIKINDEMVLSKKVYDNAVEELKNFLMENKSITLAQYRDLMNTSRKYAVSLLEYFDSAKITKRVGDNRVLY